jgi:hypothetical protein
LDDLTREGSAQQELEYGINALNQAYIETYDSDQGGPCLPFFKLPIRPYIYGFGDIMPEDKMSEDKMREEDRLWKFRSNFNEQHERLKQAAQKPSTKLDPLSWQLQNPRQAWAAAITTMRRLSRLESSPKLMDALSFLCVSRAMAETAEHDRDAYISAFSQDLKQWRKIFPEVEEVSMFMWEINLDSAPQLPQAHTTILQLRESVAALIVKSNAMFGFGDCSLHNKTDELGASCQWWPRNTDQAPPATEPPDPPARAREKEPPVRQICPNTTPLKEKTPRLLSNLVILVASIIFALVVYFMLGLCTLPPSTESSTYVELGFAHTSSTTVLGFPNPWQTPMSQAGSSSQTTPLETFPSPIPAPSLQTGSAIYNKPFSSIESIPPLRDLSQELATAPYDNTQAPAQECFHHNQIPLTSSPKGDTTRTSDYNLGDPVNPSWLNNAFPDPFSPWTWG